MIESAAAGDLGTTQKSAGDDGYENPDPPALGESPETGNVRFPGQFRDF